MSYYEQYKNYEIPHIHNSDDLARNIFEDALDFQGKLIKSNLEKYFPRAKHKEIMRMMFGDNVDK